MPVSARRRLQRQVVIPQDRARGLHRAAQVAGIQRIERHIAEALRERRDLAFAARRHLAVPVALDAAVQIALRLRVADQIKRCQSPVFPSEKRFAPPV